MLPRQQVEPNLHRSSRVRNQTERYNPSMSGPKYSYSVTELESQGVLNPYANMFVQEEFYQADPNVVASVMTQLSLKSGLRAWEDKVYTSVQSKMKELNFRNTFNPKHRRELNHKQSQTGLESHMFLKEKIYGEIKVRNVAGGKKQRDYIYKEDTSSPTIAAEVVLLS